MAPKRSVKDIYDIPSNDEDDENTPLVKAKTRQGPMPPKVPPSRTGASKDGRVVNDSQSEGEHPRRGPKRSARQRSGLVIELPQRKGPPSDVEIVDVDGDQDHNSPVEAVPKQSVDRVKKKRPARNSTSSSKFVDRGDSSTPLESDDEGDGQQGGRIAARTFTAHLSVEMVEPTREFLKALPDHKSRAHTWVRKYKTGAVNMDILNNEILPWVPRSEEWTEEDHKKIHREWRDDPTRDKRIETKTNKDIQTLTKTCLLFFRCLPEHILSRNDMEYDFGQNSTSKDGEQTLIWSAPFCKEMHALLPHAMFAGDMKLLATALQYVVMVETDDRRCWPMATPVWDEFPKQMQALSRGQETSQSRRSIVEIRKEVKSNGQQAGYAPSHWNMLFERIEQLLERAAKKKTKSQIPDREETLSEDPFQPYKVHKRHLVCLREALDQMGPFGFPAWMSTTLTAKAVNGSRPNDTFPTGKDFSQVRDRMYLYDLERSAHQKKLAATAQAQPSSGSQQAQPPSVAEAATPSQVVVPATQQIAKPGFKPNRTQSTKRRQSVTRSPQRKRQRQDQSRSPSRIPDTQTQAARPSKDRRVIRADSGHVDHAKQPTEPEAHAEELHDTSKHQEKQHVMQEHDPQEVGQSDSGERHGDVPVAEPDNAGAGSSPARLPEAENNQLSVPHSSVADMPELNLPPRALTYLYIKTPIEAHNSKLLEDVEVNNGSRNDGSHDASCASSTYGQLKARPCQISSIPASTLNDLHVTDFRSFRLEDLESAFQTRDTTMWTRPSRN